MDVTFMTNIHGFINLKSIIYSISGARHTLTVLTIVQKASIISAGNSAICQPSDAFLTHSDPCAFSFIFKLANVRVLLTHSFLDNHPIYVKASACWQVDACSPVSYLTLTY